MTNMVWDVIQGDLKYLKRGLNFLILRGERLSQGWRISVWFIT